MHIKFKATDPRAGTVAMMDSSRGQHFIDIGAAVLVKEDGSEIAGTPVLSRVDVDQALAALPGEYTDPDYVVKGMRLHFGPLFTDADEAAARSAVKPPAKKASEGLTVAQLKEALVAKGLAIPDGALKPDLVALLDGKAD